MMEAILFHGIVEILRPFGKSHRYPSADMSSSAVQNALANGITNGVCLDVTVLTSSRKQYNRITKLSRQ